MSWLNAIDNFLENGFAGGDDENTQSTGTGLDQSSTWLSDEDDDEDEEDEDEQVQLAFVTPHKLKSEELDQNESSEDRTNNDVKVLAKPTSGPASTQASAARPGNIRLQISRQPSSSEEESISSEEEEEELSNDFNQQQSTSASTGKHIPPISLSEQISLLEKPKLGDTTLTSKGVNNQTSANATVVRKQPTPLPSKPKSVSHSLPGRAKLTPQIDSQKPAPSKQPPNVPGGAKKQSVPGRLKSSMVPGRSKQVTQYKKTTLAPTTITKTDNVTTQMELHSKRHSSVDSLGKQVSFVEQTSTRSLPQNPRESAVPAGSSGVSAVENACRQRQHREEECQEQSNTPQTKNTTNQRHVRVNSDHQQTPQSTASTNLSNSAPTAKLNNTLTAVDESEQKTRQQPIVDELRKKAPDSLSDSGIKSLVSEIEELKALVDAVSSEGVRKGTARDTENGQVVNSEGSPTKPQFASSKSFEMPTSASPVSQTITKQNNDAPLSSISVSPGEHKSSEEAYPSWVSKSEATLLASNTALDNSSYHSTLNQSQGISSRDMDVSMSIHNITENATMDSLPMSIQSNTPKLRRDSSLFEVGNVSSTWNETSETSEVVPLNCYGAFHVRLLRAQQLPCPIGSTVQAIVSLIPWKGQSRTGPTTTFVLDSRDDHGVCAFWDDDDDDLDKPSSTVSLVHAYASETTPIPALNIKLVLKAMRMIEFSICSLTLPCHALMRCPGRPMRQWFLAEMQDAKVSKDSNLSDDDKTTMIEIEAVFEPEDQALGASFLSIGQNNNENSEKDKVEEEDDFFEAEGLAGYGSSALLMDSKTISGSKSSLCMDVSQRADDDSSIPQPSSKKPHLLRVKKFWKPASCAQCSASLMGWRKTSFRCEVCNLDCCEDCRLHLDVQIPCGSSKAKEIVGNAIQNKLTVGNILMAMAPVDESYDQKKRDGDTVTSDGGLSLADTKTETLTTHRAAERTRIGVLRLSVAKACVFQSTLPSVTAPEDVQKNKDDLRPGDYYVRVRRTGVEGSSRTRTIPSNGLLKFEDSGEMRLDVAYYGVEFFIEVVDALTDKPVGTTVLTTHGILQNQRDLMLERGQMSVLNAGKKPPVFKGKRRMILDLRAGVKSGVSSDFFVPAKENTEKGKISGWIEINLGLEEDVKRLYGPSPTECPAPPPDTLNLSLLNLHISRISDFVEDIISLFIAYIYLVSWKNPLLTGFSFVAFLSLTFRFNAEYVGCLPFFSLMVWMLSSAFKRSSGNTEKRFIQEEADEWRAAEKEIDVNYTLHRPVGRISIEVSKGRNIRSRDLGLAGNAGCRVYWDPLRCANAKQKEKILAIDKSANTLHEVGYTESKFTTNPTWENFRQSEECQRLKQVLPHHGHFFETEEELAEASGCEFPILQPFRKVDDDGDEPTHHINAELESWEASPGAVVFQIRFRDILNMLPGSDHVFGEVALPLSALLENSEISGWFQVLGAGTTDLAPVKEASTLGVPAVLGDTALVGGLADSALAMALDLPMIWLTVKWIPPEENTGSIEERETDREASAVIQEELLRWEFTNRSHDKLKKLVIGGAGAIQTVSGLAGTLQMIQNFLGKLVGTLEIARNLLNFTDPYKSSMILAVVALLWFVLSLIPTRLVILVAGLAQYGLTAKKRIDKIIKNGHASDDDDDISQASGLGDEEDEDAPIIWLKNAFRGVPTDEDLRKAYFWDGRRNGAKAREAYASEKRLSRLKRLWRAHWHATIKILMGSDNGKSWEKIFAIVQGRRFLWWKTVDDFDNGRPPLGRLFLAGHAGLSGLSPLEMREIDPKDVALVVGIFGAGLLDQQRITLLLPSSDLKGSLENAVIDASMKND